MRAWRWASRPHHASVAQTAVVRLSDVTAKVHRARRIGGWIAGVVVGVPVAYLAWIGFVFSLARSPATSYPWVGMLLFIAECTAVVGVAVLAGRDIGTAMGRPPRRQNFFPSSSELELDALSDERLLTLWQTIAAGNAPHGVPSYRVAAVRQAIRQAAQSVRLRDIVPRFVRPLACALVLALPRVVIAQSSGQRMVLEVASCRADPDTSADAARSYKIGEVIDVERDTLRGNTPWLSTETVHIGGLHPPCWILSGLTTPFQPGRPESALLTLTGRMLQSGHTARFEDLVAV